MPVSLGSRLEGRFAAVWIVSYPELPFVREFVPDAWREWAAERVELGQRRNRVPYKADFAWPDARVIVEIQGGIWGKGRSGHSSGRGIERDAIKSFTAQRGGWILLPFTERMMGEQAGIWLPKLAGLILERRSLDGP
jgi:very-short-patch-repair endonuclease